MMRIYVLLVALCFGAGVAQLQHNATAAAAHHAGKVATVSKEVAAVDDKKTTASGKGESHHVKFLQMKVKSHELHEHKHKHKHVDDDADDDDAEKVVTVHNKAADAKADSDAEDDDEDDDDATDDEDDEETKKKTATKKRETHDDVEKDAAKKGHSKKLQKTLDLMKDERKFHASVDAKVEKMSKELGASKLPKFLGMMWKDMHKFALPFYDDALHGPKKELDDEDETDLTASVPKLGADKSLDDVLQAANTTDDVTG